MMIVNTMTRGGYIMPLSCHGINRMDTGPLLRCSFEETPGILCDAACFGELDNGQGVSQNIMTGKLPGIGSGSMQIKVAPNMMHPRDTLRQHPMERKRVLKSSVRGARWSVGRTEGLDRHASMLTSVDAAIEAPFTCTEDHMSAEHDLGKGEIFGSEQCQVPYRDDMDVASSNNEHAESYSTAKNTPVVADHRRRGAARLTPAPGVFVHFSTRWRARKRGGPRQRRRCWCASDTVLSREKKVWGKLLPGSASPNGKPRSTRRIRSPVWESSPAPSDCAGQRQLG